MLLLCATLAAGHVLSGSHGVHFHGARCPAAVAQIGAGTGKYAKPVPLGPTDPWLVSAADLVPAARPKSATIEAIRAAAADNLNGQVFPNRKVEAWRRTDLGILGGSSLTAPSADSADMAAMASEMQADAASEGARLVLVDGVIDPALSDVSALPDGVTVGSLLSCGAEAEAAVLGALKAPLPEQGADMRTALGAFTFAALNQASLSDVACIHVPAGVSVDIPVHVLCLSSGASAEGSLTASHPSLVICMGKDASAKVLQQYSGSGAYWTNGVTRVLLDEGSSIEHSYIQEQAPAAVHIDSVQVDVGAGAAYSNSLLQSGARIGRVNMLVSLNGQGAHSKLRGLALASDNQLSDMHSQVTHAVPDCTSEQEHRNAVAGRARVVFRGAVKVPTGADNTTAAQLCRSLLLSDNARVDIQPCLEIDTDDVVCTHGATVTDLDDEMIFYLQARGLSRGQARSLLLEGWARDALATVPSEGCTSRAALKAATLAKELRAVRRDALSSI